MLEKCGDVENFGMVNCNAEFLATIANSKNDNLLQKHRICPGDSKLSYGKKNALEKEIQDNLFENSSNNVQSQLFQNSSISKNQLIESNYLDAKRIAKHQGNSQISFNGEPMNNSVINSSMA